ncbi:MAG: DUF4129 domain-containing protein [Cyclobacteriaceae bacterium]
MSKQNVISLLFLFFAVSYSKAQDSDSTEFSADTVVQKEYEQPFTSADTTHVTKSHFEEDRVQKLRSELNYTEPPTVAESLWERFKRWLSYLISRLFRGATTTNLGRLIMYVVGGIILVWIIMALLKVNAFRIFFSGADVDKPSSYQIFNENIHEMDFDKLIGDAVDKNDFRLGTRLVFLYALKILSDKHLINWSPGKTNHEYVNELEREDLRPSFNDLSIYFDYAWYGNFSVSSEKFKNVQNTFQSLKEQVGQ